MMRARKGILERMGMLTFLVLVMLLIPVQTVQAEEVEYDHIVYEVDTTANTAIVKRLNGALTDYVNVELLQTVQYQGKSYPLVGIGDSVFQGCSKMQSIVIPVGVKSIDDYCFTACINLQSIVIPDGVTDLGYCAFIGCVNLKNVTIPESVVLKKEQEAIFAYCESLESVTLPSSTTVIPPGLFIGCTNLKNVEIPSGVTSIGYMSFEDCTSLESITIPAGVTTIEYDAFYACKNLKEAFYPSGLQEQMVEASLPTTTTQIGYTVNQDKTVSLEVLYTPEGCTDITLPESIDGMKIAAIKGLENSDIKVFCTKHFGEKWGYNANEHWVEVCSLCGSVENKVKEKHSYGEGTKACECGYVPFTLKMEEKTLSAMYGEEKMITFDVTATATFGTEKIMYEWFEDGKSIIKGNVASFGVPIGKEVGTYTYYCKVSCGEYSAQSANVKVTITAPKKGKLFCHTKSGGKYKVVKNSKKKKEVTYVKPMNAKKDITIPATIKVGGVTYKVTSIAAKAFQNNKKITKVTIGKNVASIGTKAFYKCTKLKNINIKTKKLTTKKVGSKAFAKTHKKATVKVPKKKLTAYKKMLKAKGISSKAKIKK